MPQDRRGWFGSIVLTLFTSVVAPLTVQVASQGLHLPSLASAFPHFFWPVKDVGGAEERDVVVCRGFGRTPEEARQDAVRQAVLKAAATVIDPGDPARANLDAYRDVLANPADLVGHCREANAAVQYPQGVSICQKEMVIEVLRDRLIARLKARPSAQIAEAGADFTR